MKFLIFLVSSIVCFSSCQGPKEIIRETQVVSPNQAQGGIDQTGGGNGINGTPLEKFISPVNEKNS